MTTIINGSSPSITFSDGTTQSTAGLTGSASQLCQAWVNFNGITTVSVRASYNISSVVRNSTGDYTINFTNALADANYTVNTGGITSSSTGTGGGWFVGVKTGSAGTSASLKSTTQVEILTTNNGGGLTDGAEVYIAIFR